MSKNQKKGKRVLKKPKKNESKMEYYQEVYNIIVAIFVTTLILAYNFRDPVKTFDALPRAFIATALAFPIALLVQKIVARKLGCNAFYKLWLPGLIVSMLLMLVGLKPIIIVGSVALGAYKFGRWGFKSRYRTMTEIGWVGLAGPLTNILLAIIFKTVISIPYFAFVNGLLALFNLMPIEPLDGSKLMLWNPLLWILLMIITVLILTPSGILSYIVSVQGI